MLYSFKFTVPKQTSKQEPYRQDITIHKGVIKSVRIIIPFGHMSVAGMQIRYGETVVLPIGSENWIYGNNEIVEDEWFWEIDKRSETFTLVGYNESQYNDHTFVVRFLVVPPEIVPPEIMPRRIKQVIKELTGKK